jgi:hypothetical protein
MSAMTLRNGGGNSGSELSKHGLSTIAQRQRAGMIEELGGMSALSAIDMIKVDTVIRVLQSGRRAKSVTERVRCANTAQRLLAELQRKAKRRLPAPSTAEMVARMAAR